MLNKLKHLFNVKQMLREKHQQKQKGNIIRFADM